jgi:hypothetical protein
MAFAAGELPVRRIIPMVNYARSGKKMSFVASGSYFAHEHEKRVVTIRKCRLFAFVIAFLAMLPTTFAAEGKLVNEKIHSPALEGNLLGDSADRDLIVYLPPSYDTSPEQRYPTVYLLHGSFFLLKLPFQCVIIILRNGFLLCPRAICQALKCPFFYFLCSVIHSNF